MQVMYGDLRRAPALETGLRRTMRRVDRGARPTPFMDTENVQQLFEDHRALVLSDLGAAALDESRACAPVAYLHA